MLEHTHTHTIIPHNLLNGITLPVCNAHLMHLSHACCLLLKQKYDYITPLWHTVVCQVQQIHKHTHLRSVVTKLFWPKITNSALVTGKIYLLRR